MMPHAAAEKLRFARADFDAGGSRYITMITGDTRFCALYRQTPRVLNWSTRIKLVGGANTRPKISIFTYHVERWTVLNVPDLIMYGGDRGVVAETLASAGKSMTRRRICFIFASTAAQTGRHSLRVCGSGLFSLLFFPCERADGSW